MARHIEAWMDDDALSDIGPVVIQEVNEPAPDMEITYFGRPGKYGQMVQTRRRKSLRVTIRAQIHELWKLDIRNEIRDEIAKWCTGSVLKLSNHPGRQLHVICKGVPGLGDVRDFNSQLNIELEANEIPYWEEEEPVKASKRGTTGSVSLKIPGTAHGVPILAAFTPNTGNTVTSMSVSVTSGGVTKTIALQSISTAAPILISRDERDRVTITSNGNSLLRYRTAASDDELTAEGENAVISWTANCNGKFDASARGRWL